MHAAMQGGVREINSDAWRWRTCELIDQVYGRFAPLTSRGRKV